MQGYRVNPPSRIEPSCAEDWEPFFAEVRSLYWDKDYPLDSVIQYCKEKHGLYATKKQWKTALERWDLCKNIKTHEMKAIVRVKDRRDGEGKATEFMVRDRPVPQVKIDRFIARTVRTGNAPSDATPLSVWYFTPQENPVTEPVPSNPWLPSPIREWAERDAYVASNTVLKPRVMGNLTGIMPMLETHPDNKTQDYSTEDDPLASLLPTVKSVQSAGGSPPPALHQAAEFGELGVVEQLLSQGQDPYKQDQYGKLPIHYACEQGWRAIVDLLLLYDPAGIYKNSPLGVLHSAVRSNQKYITQSLLDLGFDVDSIDGQGYTALNYAVEHDHIGIAEILLNAGAAAGENLHKAAEQGSADFVYLFIQRGVDVNILNKRKLTALDVVIDTGNFQCMKVLLKHGAATERPWPYDRICVCHSVVRKADPMLVSDMVTRAGAPINDKDEAGWTAYDHAVANQNWPVTWILRQFGARAA